VNQRRESVEKNADEQHVEQRAHAQPLAQFQAGVGEQHQPHQNADLAHPQAAASAQTEVQNLPGRHADLRRDHQPQAQAVAEQSGKEEQ